MVLLGTEQRRVDTKEKWPYLRNIGVLTVFSASMAVKTAILGFLIAILAGNRPYRGCGGRYGWKLQFRFELAAHDFEVDLGFA